MLAACAGTLRVSLYLTRGCDCESINSGLQPASFLEDIRHALLQWFAERTLAAC
jgi:hypothetical protein